jgi:YlmC/YmxH family sporulation protein
MTRIGDMKNKEVVNIVDGTRLGYICDVSINWESGKIVQLIVPGPGKVMGLFGKDLEYLIPWENIKKIGEDIILVELHGDEYLKESTY